MNENLDPGDENLSPVEREIEKVLRPQAFEDFTGQHKILSNLKIFVQAAKLRGEALDHVLLHGPPGLGKTTLSHIIANEMGVNIRITSGPVLDKPGDLAGLLTNLEEGDILFIDEIHRVPRIVEEFLYSAMEDFVVNFTLDKGMYSKPLPIRLARFTLIGATTRPAMLSRPMRDRFGIQQHLDFYDEDDLTTITRRSSQILSTRIEESGAREISRRGRGTGERRGRRRKCRSDAGPFHSPPGR